ncbi:MAG: hypothetical protein GY849_18655, partial [Deltaproteobacteria bacterium]|nr:hypothetical protein [Deltaproteobacteria bacterium]
IDVSVTGTIAGGADADTLDLSTAGGSLSIALSSVASTNQFAGTDSITGGFSGISSLTGASGDTLTGLDVTSTWTTTSYTDGTDTLTISGVDKFQGGTDVDTFNISSGTLLTLAGGSGADQFNITGGDVTTSISGEAGDDTFDIDVSLAGTSIVGGTDADTLDLSDLGGSLSIALTSVASTNEFAGTDGVTGGFSGISSLTGASGDTLTGLDVASTWTTTSYTDATTQTLTISGIDKFQGGTDVDTFNISSGTLLTLAGGSGADQFNITGGDVTTSISGEAGADNFDIDVSVSGTIAGGADADTLDLSTAGGALSIALTSVASTNEFGGTDGVTGGFSGISSLTGASGDTLTGLDVTSTWTTTSYTDGTDTLTISGVDNFQGGTDV